MLYLYQELIYAISVNACNTNELKKIDAFFEKSYVRKYSTTQIFVDDILKAEDSQLLMNILRNQRHPLHPCALNTTEDNQK